MDDPASGVLAPDREFADVIRAHRPEHPVLAHLHDRMAGLEADSITSYDRMHHRHNRS